MAAAADAGTTQVSRLVLRLRADARPAEGQLLSTAALASLQGTLGQTLSGVTVTATGNAILELAHPVSTPVARQLANALRVRDDVVWAEIARGTGVRPTSAKTAVASAGTDTASVRRLIVTFADTQLAQASQRNEKPGVDRDVAVSDAAGTSLHVSRATVGGAWLVEFPVAVDMATAQAAAARLQQSGVARFAIPDFRLRTMLRPNDPYLAQGDQWNLQDPAITFLAGIDVTHAWDITTGSASMVIAVVDTGIVPHPDLTGRVLPGYDFVSDPAYSNDGDGRDADATDPGDWTAARECGAKERAADSDWHGTLVAGVLAANTSNGVGMAGIDWNARILPVRALGRCGGDFSDILQAMTWAAGLPVPGVPANPHPAKVINLSVGGESPCDDQVQAMLDQILDAGVFIAVAAGNENANADDYTPSGCAGVSTVAAIDYFGARASYSNFSTAMDIAAPGGDISRNGYSDSITSTWNDGSTVATDPSYGYADGTSFSTPEVAGVAALMLAVNPALKPAQIKALMAQSASPFAVGSDCPTKGCGAGILNAFGAVKAAQATMGIPPVASTVEYYHRGHDHYFMTASVTDIAALDSGVFSGWARTGYVFNAYVAATPGFGPVCRFYIPPAWGDSHFYSAAQSDCEIAQATWPYFDYESPNVFFIALPDTSTGACPANTTPVYRAWNQRADTNHRYMTSLAVRATMIAAGWVAEGYGPNKVSMCAPN
ncbi:MAG: S8 family peptidase [Betaproteobacteria bacterium]